MKKLLKELKKLAKKHGVQMWDCCDYCGRTHYDYLDATNKACTSFMVSFTMNEPVKVRKSKKK